MLLTPIRRRRQTDTTKEMTVPARAPRVGNVSGGSSVDLAEMNYTIEGGYFDRFPYAPYVPPGTVRPASHNDRPYSAATETS